MAYCRKCGAELQSDAWFCPVCGTPTEEIPVREPVPELPAGKPKKARKSIFRRWWFWALAAILVIGVIGGGGKSKGKTAPQSVKTAATAAPAATAKPTAEPTAAPTAEPTPTEAPAISESDIRPEVKEFLDAYEAFMDEYVEFMQKYAKADANSMASMMGDYFSMMSRYAEFSEVIDALDEADLTNAELALYLDVTNRVNQKLLKVMG